MKNLRKRDRLWAGLRSRLAAALLAAIEAVAVEGQSTAKAAASSPDSGPRVILASAGLAETPALLPGRLIRVIEDPNLGDRWLLCRNVDHPGGPGRLLLVQAGARSAVWRSPAGGTRDSEALENEQAVIRPVIRAGDRVVVEENSAVVEARLGAIALESATVGSGFKARLEIGGKLVRAIALGTGRASFQPETGVRR